MMFLFWIIIGFGIYYLYTNREQNVQKDNRPSAEDQLKERYVNGEIDTETFRHILKALNE